VHHADPDLLVAEGAAIHAAMLARDAAVSDLVVTDVASHSLGVSTSKMLAGQIAEGYFSPIIHRNTVIPASRWHEYFTITPGQTGVRFGIYEGESRLVVDNRKIGEISVPVPAGPPGKAVRVRLTYDHDGMLEIEALVVETGRVASAVFHREAGEVTGPALEGARARLRALRADPMDRPRYRDLHARAKLLWQESNERDRQVVGFLIDEFDAAIAGRNPAEIEHCYHVLLRRCEASDGGERW
jgi:molecular chaperone HscC